MATETSSPAQRLIGDVAPKLAQLTDDVLFGDVWARPGLSPRDRSLITVATLTALYRTGQLPSHLRLALSNGLTPDELVEAITHLAFYAGWPNAMTAATALKEVLAEQATTAETHDDGARRLTGPARHCLCTLRPTQHHPDRRRCPRPGLHRRTHAGHPRGNNPARQGV
ncbi:carboxymuconolactone decarboxylase family protein [Arthrobacter oryzae]|uniref:carboxymuconolactone decarboxylase family protein n=1 Tax=Arthrobacter oryzae TaxID=409290 RepID=UPI00285FAFF6|nr:carboxymuconolactone decarboxylase family protein [Arthrobacter oryzae]MDR6504851.1 alkylhydroperoxidase/carboxymuconolactone decarboxylase family protein YurZ [Arthrobacter oryzae]